MHPSWSTTITAVSTLPSMCSVVSMGGTSLGPPHLDLARGFAICVHKTSATRSGQRCDEDMRRDLVRQHHPDLKVPTACARTCHPHIIVADHQRNLAAGLYPDVL